MSPRGVTVWNNQEDSLFSSKREINRGIRNFKKKSSFSSSERQEVTFTSLQPLLKTNSPAARF
jgi:hypothetical protein